MKDECIGMNKKQKVRIKAQRKNIDIFSNQTFQELTDYLLWFIQMWMIILKGINPEGIIYRKVLLRKQPGKTSNWSTFH